MSEYYGQQKVQSPDETFLRNIEGLARQSEAMGNFILSGYGGYVWNMCGPKTPLNPCKHSDVRDMFSRDSLDNKSQQVYDTDNSGTVSDAVAIRLQAAYLQAMERAFRLRHASLARSEAFSAKRRISQANQKGPLLGPSGVKGYITKLIQLGARA